MWTDGGRDVSKKLAMNCIRYARLHVHGGVRKQEILVPIALDEDAGYSQPVQVSGMSSDQVRHPQAIYRVHALR